MHGACFHKVLEMTMEVEAAEVRVSTAGEENRDPESEDEVEVNSEGIQ